jgi:hypothetical protein
VTKKSHLDSLNGCRHGYLRELVILRRPSTFKGVNQSLVVMCRELAIKPEYDKWWRARASFSIHL